MVAQLIGSMGKKFTSSFDRLVIMLMPIIEYINFEEMSTMSNKLTPTQYTKVLNAVFAKATSFQGWPNLYSPSYDDVSKAEAKLNIDNIKITTEEVTVTEAKLYHMDGIKVTTGEVKVGLMVQGVGSLFGYYLCHNALNHSKWFKSSYYFYYLSCSRYSRDWGVTKRTS